MEHTQAQWTEVKACSTALSVNKRPEGWEEDCKKPPEKSKWDPAMIQLKGNA